MTSRSARGAPGRDRPPDRRRHRRLPTARSRFIAAVPATTGSTPPSRSVRSAQTLAATKRGVVAKDLHRRPDHQPGRTGNCGTGLRAGGLRWVDRTGLLPQPTFWSSTREWCRPTTARPPRSGVPLPAQGEQRINPNLGGITATALRSDSDRRITARWELLTRSGLLSRPLRLDRAGQQADQNNDHLVSFAPWPGPQWHYPRPIRRGTTDSLN
jgi:hypothetical protein